MTDPKTSQSAQNEAERLADKLKATASEVLDEAKNEGRRAIDDARRSAEELAEKQKDGAAARVDNVASALRGASDDMRAKDEKMVANLTEAAADQLVRLSNTLTQKNLGSLVDHASDLARRHPAAFLGGAVMLGFMAARFAKSSDSPDEARTGASGSSHATMRQGES